MVDNYFRIPSKSRCINETCKFRLEDEPRYDSSVASKMEPNDIREKFPRIAAICINCGHMTIRYASFEHYIAGDW